uniref:Uncharacterized protein n=1 Tax=Romanomermis culicivorax TaxID=13658 RepID=A0A915KBI3_ROMCU
MTNRRNPQQMADAKLSAHLLSKGVFITLLEEASSRKITEKQPIRMLEYYVSWLRSSSRVIQMIHYFTYVRISKNDAESHYYKILFIKNNAYEPVE